MDHDIRRAVGFLRHPKTIKLRALLGADGVLCLEELWCFARIYRPSGDLSDMDPKEIAIAASWPGDAEIFLSALIQCRFVDSTAKTLKIHDWKDHQAYAINEESRRERARHAANVRHSKRNHAPSNAPSNARDAKQPCSGYAPSPAPAPDPAPDPPPPPAPHAKSREEEEGRPPVGDSEGGDPGATWIAFRAVWESESQDPEGFRRPRVQYRAAKETWDRDIRDGTPLARRCVEALQLHNRAAYLPRIHPDTWLRDGRWDEEPPSTPAAIPPGNPMGRDLRVSDEERERRDAMARSAPHAEWEAVMASVRPKIGEQAWSVWLESARLLASDDHGLLVELPNALFVRWVEQQYRPLLNGQRIRFVAANEPLPPDDDLDAFEPPPVEAAGSVE